MRDPRTGRFIAAPSMLLSGRAADMLVAFNEGREAGRKDRWPALVWYLIGAVAYAVVNIAIRAVWP